MKSLLLSVNSWCADFSSLFQKPETISDYLPVLKTMKVRPFFALTCVLSLGACKPAPPKTTPPPPTVSVATVVQLDVPIVRNWIGTLEGFSNAEVKARVAGYVMERNYVEGAAVKKDDQLFLIDPRPFQTALAQAKAQLSQAQAVQERSKLELDKTQTLFKQGVVSQRDIDNNTQTNLANVANVQAATAAVGQAELNLFFTKVTAPVDGIVGIANVGVGDLVGPSTGSMTAMSTVDPIKAKFPISEDEYLTFAKDLSASIEKPLAERKPLADLLLTNGEIYPTKGTMYAVDRQVSIKTGTIIIEVTFPNPGNILRPGQFAKVSATVSSNLGALLVPQRAVTETQGSFAVAVVGADNKVEPRPVKTGERVGTMWVISQGLKPGEQVVVEGLQKMIPDQVVTTKPWVPAPTATPAPTAPPLRSSPAAVNPPPPAAPLPPVAVVPAAAPVPPAVVPVAVPVPPVAAPVNALPVKP